MASLLKALDPDGAHLRPFDQGSVAVGPSVGVDQVWASGYWSPDGNVDSLRKEDPQSKLKPYGAVNMYSWAPGAAPRNNLGPCGIWDNGVDADMHIAWSFCEKHTLKDGSYIVTSHATSLGPAQIILASRVFPDGAAVTVSVANTLVYDHSVNDHTTVLRAASDPKFGWGKSLEPMPWTEKAVADALAASAVKEQPAPAKTDQPADPKNWTENGQTPGSDPALTVRQP